jgi:rhamnosyltransferase
VKALGCDVLPYVGNEGTAGGFNRGVQALLASGAEEYVLLLDQDSRAPDGMVEGLVAASRAGTGAGLAIAAVGPLLGDVKDERVARPLPPRVAAGLIPVETLASSGTLVRHDVLARIGPLDATLFIDGVDHEWCLRARAQGLASYVAPHVRLAHNMGDRLVRLGGRPRPIHDNPVRHYYIVRNSLLLARRAYLPARWRARELALTVRRIVAYALLSARRRESTRNMVRAIADGLAGRSGPMNPPPRDRVRDPD